MRPAAIDKQAISRLDVSTPGSPASQAVTPDESRIDRVTIADARGGREGVYRGGNTQKPEQ